MTLGINLGVSTLVTAFNGEVFPIERTAPRKLRRGSAVFGARQKGSARRRARRIRLNVIHRKVRERRNDILHQFPTWLTAKAGVIKFETLNVKGMMRSNVALSVANAGMSRLVTFTAFKVDWWGRRVEKLDPWFPSTPASSQSGCITSDMKNLTRRVFCCAACGHTEGRDRNASRNINWYGEDGTRSATSLPGGEIAEQRAGHPAQSRCRSLNRE